MARDSPSPMLPLSNALPKAWPTLGQAWAKTILGVLGVKTILGQRGASRELHTWKNMFKELEADF